MQRLSKSHSTILFSGYTLDLPLEAIINNHK